MVDLSPVQDGDLGWSQRVSDQLCLCLAVSQALRPRVRLQRRHLPERVLQAAGGLPGPAAHLQGVGGALLHRWVISPPHPHPPAATSPSFTGQVTELWWRSRLGAGQRSMASVSQLGGRSQAGGAGQGAGRWASSSIPAQLKRCSCVSTDPGSGSGDADGEFRTRLPVSLHSKCQGKTRALQNKSTTSTFQEVIEVIALFPVPDDEGSAPDVGRKFTKCSTCKYGAECDEDSEDVW